MIQVCYERYIPYPIGRVMSQYFDVEHLEHVHPRTFGRGRLVTQHANSVVWELTWPAIAGVKLRSVIRRSYISPREIRSVLVSGWMAGTEITTVFEEAAVGMRLKETYTLGLPPWRWLRGLVTRAVHRRLDRIWLEDLRVGMCHGGWPGVPGSIAS